MAIKPIKPTVNLPVWAYGALAEKIDPGTAKRELGWSKASPTSTFGEAPPYQWFNNEAYNNGVWSTYFNDFASYVDKYTLGGCQASFYEQTADVTVSTTSTATNQYIMKMVPIQFLPFSQQINTGDSDSTISYNTTQSSSPDYLAFKVPYDGFYFIRYLPGAYYSNGKITRYPNSIFYYSTSHTFGFLGILLNSNPLDSTYSSKSAYNNYLKGSTAPIIIKTTRQNPPNILAADIGAQITYDDQSYNFEEMSTCIYLRKNEFFKIVAGNSLSYSARSNEFVVQKKIAPVSLKPSVLDIVGFPVRNP